MCCLLDSFKICVIKPRYCPPIIAIGADTRSYNNVKNFLTHSTPGRGMARQLGPPDRGVRTVAAPCDCGGSEVSDNCCELFLIVFLSLCLITLYIGLRDKNEARIVISSKYLLNLVSCLAPAQPPSPSQLELQMISRR